MAFKFITFLATLALANAGIVHEQPAVVVAAHHAPSSASYSKTYSYTEPKHSYVHHEPVYHQQAVHYAPAVAYHHGHYEHGSSEQNIIRTPHGTVSQISKNVDTPHSSVRKSHTQIHNDGYKTVQYAQPAYYAHHQPAVHYAHAAPVVEKHVVSAPAVVKTISQPIVAAQVHHAHQPTYYSAPVVQKSVYSHQPAAVYAHQPAVYAKQAYVHEPVHHVAHAPVIAQKAIHYSPAIEVSHASFESPIVHYSW